MKVERGSFTVTATGNKIVSLNDATLNVDKVVFAIITDTTNEKSYGFGDTSIDFSAAKLGNATSLTKSIIHNRTVGGVTTRTAEGRLTSKSTAGEFTINFSTLTQSTQVEFVAYGS